MKRCAESGAGAIAHADTQSIHDCLKGLFEKESIQMLYPSGSRVWISLRANQWRWIDGRLFFLQFFLFFFSVDGPVIRVHSYIMLLMYTFSRLTDSSMNYQAHHFLESEPTSPDLCALYKDAAGWASEGCQEENGFICELPGLASCHV